MSPELCYAGVGFIPLHTLRPHFYFKTYTDQTPTCLLVFSVPSVSLFDFPFNEEGFNEPYEVCFGSSIYTPGRSCSYICCTEEYTSSTQR